MASMRKTAHSNLENMVKGAAKAAQKRSSSSRPPKKAVKLLSSDLHVKLQSQIQDYGKTIQKIPLDLIELGENIRTRYDEDKLKLLAVSLSKDGLIQFPTLCMRKVGQGYRFVCRNGHRRILAAKSLGWNTIECMIIPFDSAKAELYHSINANLSEDMFYLDIAHAYEDASQMGESDRSIASRVGMNSRTIGWYRRLSKMSHTCQELCKSHPDLFTATWAIKLARQGELPESSKLEAMMNEMIKEGKSWLRSSGGERLPLKISPAKKRQATQNIRKMFGGRAGRSQAAFARELLEQLREAGYISNSSLSRIDKEFFKENKSSLVKNSLKARRESRA